MAWDSMFSVPIRLVLKYPHIGEYVVWRCFEKINDLGVLHGDIRMANIMLRNDDGRVVVIDFGLATFREKRIRSRLA
jgi:tRNA A-37 threonylcarbamoyl transferase component Bud32